MGISAFHAFQPSSDSRGEHTGPDDCLRSNADLRLVLRVKRADEPYVGDVARPFRYMAYKTAELTDDLAILIIEDMLIAGIISPVTRHHVKSSLTLEDALLDHCPAAGWLTIDQSVNPRWRIYVATLLLASTGGEQTDNRN